MAIKKFLQSLTKVNKDRFVIFLNLGRDINSVVLTKLTRCFNEFLQDFRIQRNLVATILWILVTRIRFKNWTDEVIHFFPPYTFWDRGLLIVWDFTLRRSNNVYDVNYFFPYRRWLRQSFSVSFASRILPDNHGTIVVLWYAQCLWNYPFSGMQQFCQLLREYTGKLLQPVTD